MINAVDPTYPFFPIASVLATVMLLLVFLTSFIRQSWNLGVAFLCFWLFFENLTNAINSIVWADNADIRLYAYCDIASWSVTRLQVFTSVVKPMATLIITRRLSIIASQHSVDPVDHVAKLRRNTAIEWTLGLLIPAIVAGPLFYVVQQLRFEVLEGFGCSNSQDGSILDLLLIWSWTVFPPLVSVIVYYPKIVLLLYRHNRSIDRFLQRDDSVSRSHYFRVLALASIDVIFTLPIGIASVVVALTDQASQHNLPFYGGWVYVHSDWAPESYPYSELEAGGALNAAQQYFGLWTTPVLAFIIFGLFGITSEACASYRRLFHVLGSWRGWKATSNEQESVQPISGDTDLSVPPLDTWIEPEPRLAQGPLA
ncbi:unnamed protein product [Peniophora sp. CBMAI 1063]|nr:unnamed protein product [Peniophora sp. CBMAI 1063]